MSASISKYSRLLCIFAFSFAAAAESPRPGRSAVTIAFDQAWSGIASDALPITREKNLRAVVYVSTGWVGKLGFLSWDQLRELNQDGREIGASSVNHVLLTELSPSELDYEIRVSKEELAAHGLPAVSFCSSFGDYNARVVAAIASYFQSHRAFEHPKPSLSTRKQDQPAKDKILQWKPAPQVVNVYPFNRYLLYVHTVEPSTSAAEVKRWLAEAKTERAWLILLFTQKGSPQFRQIAEAVKSSGVSNVTVRDMLASSGENLVPNGSFQSGLGDGWTAKPEAQAHLDTGNHGAWPESRNSVELMGGESAADLESPAIAVPAGSSAVQAFVNAASLEAGELIVSAEEYSGANQRIGERILGKYPASNGDVFQSGWTYIPTAEARSVRLRFRLSEGAKGKVYVDDVAWVRPAAAETALAHAKWTWADPPYKPMSEQLAPALAALPSFGKIEWKLERLPFVPPGPQGGISGVAIAAVDGKLYMAGGYIPGGDETADRASRETSRWAYSYDPATHTWNKLPDLPARREYPRGLTDGRSFYVAGGGIQLRGTATRWQVSADCFRLDPGQPHPSWERCGELNDPRSHMASGRLGHYLALAGGTQYDAHFEDPYRRIATAEVLDLDHPEKGWRRRASLPGPRAWSAGAACNGTLYSIGGIAQNNTALTDTLSYDPERDRWTQRAPLPMGAHSWEGACYANRYVIVAGGCFGSSEGNIWSDLAFAYDTKEDRWLRIENKLPGDAVMSDPSVAIIGETIFVAGAEGPKGTHFDYLRVGHIVPKPQ